MALDNLQYDELMRQYDEVRIRNRAVQDAHIAEIYEKIPEIDALNQEISDRSLAAARQRIADPTFDLSAYRAELAQIEAKKSALLIRAGYPADYLDLHYDCPICHDTGFTDGRHCVCFDRAAAQLLYGKSGLGPILEAENFASFSFDWYSDTIKDEQTGTAELVLAQNAVDAARDLASSDQPRNLYIYGNTGVGKSFLTHCIAKEALDRGRNVLYFSAPDFFDRLAESAFGRTRSHDAVSMIERCDILIIDDLGSELTNAFTSSELFRILNERIRKGLSTVISTNLTLDALARKYSERVFSRITSFYKVLRLSGNDIRVRKKLQQ